MFSIYFYAVILAIFVFAFSVIFFSVFRKTHESAIGLWGASWGVYGLGILFQLLFIDALPESYILVFQQTIFSLSALLLLAGTYHFIGKAAPRFWFFLFLANVGWLAISLYFDFTYYLEVLPLSVFYSIVAIYTGIEFLQEWPLEGLEKSIAGIIFIIWGIHKSYYFYLRPDFSSSSTHYLLELILIFALNLSLFFVFIQKNNQTLKKNEKIFRLLTENAKDIIYLYTTKPDLNFEYISPNVTRILGYTQEDFCQNPYLFQEIVHPDDKELLDLNLTPNLSPHDSVAIRYRSKPGQYRWFQEYTTLIHDSSGEIFGIEGRLQDITEEKQCRDAKSRSDMERQKLLYVISHELKTPITALRGNLESILDHKVPQNERSIVSSITNAYEKTRLLERLVTDLFELSQFESGKFSFHYSLLSFEESFAFLFEKLEQDILHSGRVFHLDISEEIDTTGTEFIMDIERIDQVMYNLVNNAIKNTREDDTISIRCTLLNEEQIRIVISDTGSGIGKEDLPHIFEMFYTAANQRNRGTGLGLAITKEILNKHHAEIAVESELEKGTSFIIQFPICTG